MGGNNVYSVIKRHKLREERLKFINKEYELKWGKMEIKWEKIYITNYNSY